MLNLIWESPTKMVVVLKSNDEEALVNAAMELICGYFTSPTDFVIKLAVLVEKDAEEQGEDTWKERDTTRCINEAIKGYLLFLKDENEDEKGSDCKKNFFAVRLTETF